MNLCENAIHYSLNRSKVTLSVTYSDNDSSLIIRIKNDTDLLIPSNQNKLFSKFYRGDGATFFHPEGLGLGLFFSYHVCRVILKGRIKFEQDRASDESF